MENDVGQIDEFLVEDFIVLRITLGKKNIQEASQEDLSILFFHCSLLIV